MTDKDLWTEITRMTNLHGYMSGVNRESERVKATGEVYTPTELVIEMMQRMLEEDPEIFAPGKTLLDPACGDGQLLVPVKWYKVFYHGMFPDDATDDLYGVDIMRDNVDLCKNRLGGGHIIMGNTLDPRTRLDEQTDEEYAAMIDWFDDSASLESFFS